MPRKYKSSYPTKPATSVHPSLTPAGHNGSLSSGIQRGTAASSSSDGTQSSSSVNDMLTRLRGIQTRAAPGTDAPHETTATASPLSAHVYLQPPSQHQPALTPQARWIARLRARALPGPPAPASWGNARTNMANYRKTDLELESEARKQCRRIDRLPGLVLPRKGSLTYQALKRVAMDWSDYLRYEPDNLARIPTHLKKSLLAFLVIYGPGFVPPEELQLMFRDQSHVEGATGVGSIRHVHLAFATCTAGCRERGYKDIARLIIGDEFIKAAKSHNADQNTSRGCEDYVPESWDEDIDDESEYLTTSFSGMTIGGVPTIKPRFAEMTHLDLSNASFASWKHLIRDATPYLGQLTHLSLAYWPAPSLTPNSRTTILLSASGSQDGRTIAFDKSPSANWSEAATIFQKMGRHLPRLKWLDLQGISDTDGWVDVLRSQGSRRIDWAGTFGGLETLIIGQGSTPTPFLDLKSMQEFIDEWLVSAVIALRTTGLGALWINRLNLEDPIKTMVEFGQTHRYRLVKEDIRHVYMWLEKEYRAVAVARYIRTARNAAGASQKIDIVLSERRGWVEGLLKHPERGRQLSEEGEAGVNMLRLIGPHEDWDLLVEDACIRGLRDRTNVS